MAAQADQMAEEGPTADPATEQSEEPVA